MMPGGGDCPRCRGAHPECTVCPNDLASRDPNVDVQQLVANNHSCYYTNGKKSKPCGGVGHYGRHHVEALSGTARAEHDSRQKAKGKGGGKGGGKKKPKGKGGGASRLDFNDSPDRAEAEQLVSEATRSMLVALEVHEYVPVSKNSGRS